MKAAWAIYRPDAKWPLKVTNDFPDKDGWTNRRDYSYQTSPNEKRDVGVSTMRANDTWTVTIYDMTQAVGEKRGAQVALIFGRLFPKGYERETFAGKTAKKLGDKEIAALSAFLETGLRRRACRAWRSAWSRTERSSSPTASASARSAAPTKPDADTLFMIASNTKALTTLMLAKLVDEGKIHVGYAGDDAAAIVQAGRRRHHEPRARETSDLRVHRLAATGFRVALPVQGRDLGRCAEDAGHDAADDQVRRDVPVPRIRWPARPDSSAATSRFPRCRSAPPTTRRWPIACSSRWA